MDDRAGKVVARGRIRVDARKAVDKLRDHMLVDLHLYACELARVAVAGGARTLEVTEDERSVAYAFTGALPADAVARARDEVLSGDTGEIHPLRCLGIAISAALSLGFEVEVLTDSTSVCFSDAAAAPRSVPANVAPGTVRVIVRSRGLGAALGRMFGAAARRELALLRAAADGGPLAITVDGEAVRPSLAAPFVLRVPLDEPETTLCVLDVLDSPLTSPAEIVFRENGIRLASYPLELARMGSETLPLRVIVDAPRLPTNASRSEVRFDGGLAERVLRHAEAMLDRIVATLDAAVVRGAAVDGSFAVGGDMAAFSRALAAMAVAAARAGAGAGSPERTKRLMGLPLLDTAFGTPISIAGALVRRPILVYDGTAPLPARLAPLLGGDLRRGVIVWKHGRPAERVLEGLPTVPADDIVAQALVGAKRRARALEHPVRRPRLEEGRAWQLRQTFETEKGVFAGLEGEIGVARDGAVPSARLFIEGRFLEKVPLPGVKLPIELALAWPRRFAPTLAYDAVERNSSFSVAIDQAVRVAALAIAEHTDDDPELVRLATFAWAVATRTLGEDASNTMKLAPFVDAAVWPLANGGVTSLGALGQYASKHDGVVSIAPGSSDAATDRRPLLHDAYARLVGEILPGVRFVPYERREPAPLVPARGVDDVLEAKLARFRRISGEPGFLDRGEGAELFLELHAATPFRAEAALADVAWRTVQGPTTTLSFGTPTIWFATRSVTTSGTVPWPEPIVILPPGQAGARLQSVLRAVAVTLVDASEEIARWRESQRPPQKPQKPRPLAVVPPPLLLPSEPATPLLSAPPDAPPVEEPPLLSAPPDAPPVEEPPSFLDSLVRHAWTLFEGPPEVLGTSPLTQALAEALSGLALTGRPVDAVVESTRGRPLRYEPGARRVVVNTRHRSIARLLDTPERLTHLILAATSEINRELVAVTDAEEIAVLTALLRANADR